MPEAEAAEAAATPEAGAADTAITGEAGQAQSSEAGQGGAQTDAGQGADKDKAAEGGAQAEEEAPKGEEGGETSQGAPEKYADFQMPEGYTLEGDMLESVTAFAKAHNLTQEGAQALVDLGAKQAQAIVAQFTTEAQENPVLLAQHWAKTWSEQTTQDAEIGGQNLKANMTAVNRVFATFGSPELGEFLNKTGLAHHPELIRFMHKVGKAVAEDTLVTPSGGQGSKQPGRDPASKLYPSMA
jgi:hypothetical protein